jgi:hypothetical protein
MQDEATQTECWITFESDWRMTSKLNVDVTCTLYFDFLPSERVAPTKTMDKSLVDFTKAIMLDNIILEISFCTFLDTHCFEDKTL